MVLPKSLDQNQYLPSRTFVLAARTVYTDHTDNTDLRWASTVKNGKKIRRLREIRVPKSLNLDFGKAMQLRVLPNPLLIIRQYHAGFTECRIFSKFRS